VLSDAAMSGGKAVFLDLNGTLVMPISAESPQDFIELPGARQAVRRLVLAGFICPVITVQSRIAKGVYSQGQFNDWFARFQADWASEGALLSGPYVCPHRFYSGCNCAKPQPALYLQACRELHLDPCQSFVIGDSAADVFAATNIGARGCLVLTGNGCKDRDDCEHEAFVVGDSIHEVVERLLEPTELYKGTRR
jgi:D-glycero-D-manno-heptose 1,7-bisphosphate phosphatase